MNINDGGPAFPTQIPCIEKISFNAEGKKYVNTVAALPGMSLRDYFAAKAQWTDIDYLIDRTGCDDDDLLFVKRICEARYKFADAMLAEREARV